MTHRITHLFKAAISLSILSLAFLTNSATAQSQTQFRGNSKAMRSNTQVARQPTTKTRIPSTPAQRPGGNNNGYRPNNSNNGHQNNGNVIRPGNGNHNNQQIRPGGNTRPGTSVNRPGGDLRPGGLRPGTSVTRPGQPAYGHPSYRPMRPNGGYWGAPVLSPYRWRRHPYVAPSRPVYVVTGVPTIGSVLGLTFGSLIDYGINTLYSAGYNVLGYENNVVSLANVPMLGYSWPFVTVNYVDGRMNYTQFQYWTSVYNTSRFDRVYSSLCSTYGSPIESSTYNGISTFTWWGGSNTGYVTLQFGQGNNYNGGTQFYTNLIYGAGN